MHSFEKVIFIFFYSSFLVHIRQTLIVESLHPANIMVIKRKLHFLRTKYLFIKYMHMLLVKTYIVSIIFYTCLRN